MIIDRITADDCHLILHRIRDGSCANTESYNICRIRLPSVSTAIFCPSSCSMWSIVASNFQMERPQSLNPLFDLLGHFRIGCLVENGVPDLRASFNAKFMQHLHHLEFRPWMCRSQQHGGHSSVSDVLLMRIRILHRPHRRSVLGSKSPLHRQRCKRTGRDPESVTLSSFIFTRCSLHDSDEPAPESGRAMSRFRI